jgi:hypothetical protein
MALPLQSFGAGVDTELNNAINIAKSLFTIPADYSNFESSISSEDGQNVYYLYWRTKGSDNAYISVRINGTGTVLGYETYKYSDYTQSKKLPKVSRQEAKTKADAFIKKVNPSISTQIKYVDSYQNDIKENFYYFTYYRIVNGLPFYNDRVNVTVNKETGNVQNYNTMWTEGLTFPKPGSEISTEQAKEAYKAKLGLRLQYKYSYSDEKLKTFLVYTPRYSNDVYAIEAFTGDKVKVGNGYYGNYSTGAITEKAMLDIASGVGNGVVLSPEEQKAIQDAAKLKTKDDAEKIARDTAFLELTKDYELKDYNLSQVYPTKDEYIWSLSFTKASADNKSAGDYLSVSINANTGRIMSFYRNPQSDDSAVVKYKLEDTKAEVDKFLKDNYTDLYAEMQYDADYEEAVLSNTGSDLPRSYDYKYNRMVSGVAFPDNGITIGYDAVTGKMTSLNLEWFNTEFPSGSKVISLDTAYSKLFSVIGLEKQYKTVSSDISISTKIVGGVSQKPEVKLVYSLKEDKPLYLDANSGVVVDSQGNTYKENKPVSYSDISKSPAKKEITVLAENGVYIEDTKFYPESNITQLDFFILLSKTLSYYGIVKNSKSSQNEINDLYTYLEREGVVKSGEKAPTAEITREEAVKFIIRAMKYDKVADIKGIFKSSLKDIKNVQSSLTGYITIAEGLKIISGTKGYFYPAKKLTREAAAVMIYNYLQV